MMPIRASGYGDNPRRFRHSRSRSRWLLVSLPRTRPAFFM
jgi:hypothetical protein